MRCWDYTEFIHVLLDGGGKGKSAAPIGPVLQVVVGPKAGVKVHVGILRLSRAFKSMLSPISPRLRFLSFSVRNSSFFLKPNQRARFKVSLTNYPPPKVSEHSLIPNICLQRWLGINGNAPEIEPFSLVGVSSTISCYSRKFPNVGDATYTT